MKVTLQTRIQVEKFAIFAELAWMQKRPEIGILCRAAQEDGACLSEALIQSILPGIKSAGATNILSWLHFIGICDSQDALTPLGLEVSQSNEAPVPEQGVYAFWMASHTLMGNRALHVERRSTTQDSHSDSLCPIANKPDMNRVFQSVLDQSERFIVRSFPSNHGQIQGLKGNSDSQCSLSWDIDFVSKKNQWVLEGTIEKQAIRHQAESDASDLWNEVDTWFCSYSWPRGHWDPKRFALAIPFVAIKAEELQSFKANLDLRAVELPFYGAFSKATIQGLPLAPASAADAQKWAESRLKSELSHQRRYRSWTEIRSLFAEVTENTALESFQPVLSNHAKVLKDYSNDRGVFWSIAAPVDLAPYPITSENLEEMKIGEISDTTLPLMDGSIHISYGHKMSMQQLITKLMGGRIPESVLLCDRYVRGDKNLAMLKVFVQALRAISPEVKIDVWTGDDCDDFKSIQGITGQPACSYKGVFGRNTPHDRYLIVKSKLGDNMAWHMSNSPLDARTTNQAEPSSQQPLRWRDFGAFPIPQAEVGNEFARWVKGGQ